MKTETLLAVMCRWLNSLGYMAIQAPSDNPAPKGRYIAVYAQGTRQHGDILVPGPRHADKNKYKSVIQVTQIQLYEVEGDGDWLRDVRTRLQLDEFDEFVRKNTEISKEGLDNTFSVWNIGDVNDNSTHDGGYWIQQRTMSFELQYMDYMEHNTGRIESVNGVFQDNNLNVKENFNVEVE